MGIMRGSVKIRRYSIANASEVPFTGSDWRDQIRDTIQAYQFQGFADDRESVAGWVSISDAFAPFVLNCDWFVDGGWDTPTVALTLRTDTRKVPRALLKQETNSIELEWKQKQGKEQLTRGERDEAKEVARARLISRALPSTRLTDMVWFSQTGEVWSWATGTSDDETMRQLFEKTFGARLVPVVQPSNDPNVPTASGFLEWLWWKTTTEGGAFDQGTPAMILFVGDRATFEDAAGKISATNTDLSESTEAKAALASGKRLTSLRVEVCIEDREYQLTIKAPLLDFLSVKIPKITADPDDDVTATALLRLDAIRGIVGPLSELWDYYCETAAEFDIPAVDVWKTSLVHMPTES